MKTIYKMSDAELLQEYTRLEEIYWDLEGPEAQVIGRRLDQLSLEFRARQDIRLGYDVSHLPPT